MAGKMQQYLRTEYIQPPPGPPTLDAKNSPLALLAQTCSAIGKEPSSSSKSSLHTKLYSSGDAKKSPSRSFFHKSSSTSPTTVNPNKSASPLMPEVRRSPQSGSLKREKSPPAQTCSPPKKMRSSPDVNKMSDVVKPRFEDSKSSARSPVEQKKHPFTHDLKRRHTTANDDSDSRSTKVDSPRHKSTPSASPHTSRPFSGSCVRPPVSSSADGSRQSRISSSPQHQMMSFYDPYCLSCQGPHPAGNPCFEGIKSPQLLFNPFHNPATTYPIYAHMLNMAAAARSGGATAEPTLHVCNWVNSGTGNCGKRFTTADELCIHLRTHVVSSTNTSSANNYLMSGLEKMVSNPYAAYLSQQAAVLASASPSAVNPVNANFLSRSHSPLNRYNPYKNSSMLSQLSGLPSLPIAAGAGPYCSPYALYGQRLGAAASGFSYQ